MTPIPTMLEPPIWLDLKHLRECQVRGCTVCDELRRDRPAVEPCLAEHPLDVIERILS